MESRFRNPNEKLIPFVVPCFPFLGIPILVSTTSKNDTPTPLKSYIHGHSTHDNPKCVYSHDLTPFWSIRQLRCLRRIGVRKAQGKPSIDVSPGRGQSPEQTVVLAKRILALRWRYPPSSSNFDPIPCSLVHSSTSVGSNSSLNLNHCRIRATPT